MNDQPLPSKVQLEIQTPCPKTWQELEGGEKKRFCAACTSHVHDAAQFTESEARALVSNSSSRVCMRLTYDESGAPIFRSSPPALAAGVPPQRLPTRWAHWAMSAAAGLLAACQESAPAPAPNDPATSSAFGQTPSKMGKVCAPERLGDVAVPPPSQPEVMGIAAVSPDPAADPAPSAPPPNGAK